MNTSEAVAESRPDATLHAIVRLAASTAAANPVFAKTVIGTKRPELRIKTDGPRAAFEPPLVLHRGAQADHRHVADRLRRRIVRTHAPAGFQMYWKSG